MTHRAKSNQQRGLSGLGVLACKFIPNSFTIKNMRNTQNENRMLPFLFMAAFLLAAASIRAGTIALVLTILVNVGLVIVYRLATGRMRQA